MGGGQRESLFRHLLDEPTLQLRSVALVIQQNIPSLEVGSKLLPQPGAVLLAALIHILQGQMRQQTTSCNKREGAKPPDQSHLWS